MFLSQMKQNQLLFPFKLNKKENLLGLIIRLVNKASRFKTNKKNIKIQLKNWRKLQKLPRLSVLISIKPRKSKNSSLQKKIARKIRIITMKTPFGKNMSFWKVQSPGKTPTLQHCPMISVNIKSSQLNLKVLL